MPQFILCMPYIVLLHFQIWEHSTEPRITNRVTFYLIQFQRVSRPDKQVHLHKHLFHTTRAFFSSTQEGTWPKLSNIGAQRISGSTSLETLEIVMKIRPCTLFCLYFLFCELASAQCRENSDFMFVTDLTSAFYHNINFCQCS